MDSQQLLATLIQLSDQQQSRIAELLNRLEGQAQTLTRASPVSYTHLDVYKRQGQASGHAAYIAREGRYAGRDGYEDLEATGYGNMPSWAEGEPALFWAAADRHERANGATYREIEIALPRELDPAQRQELVLDFIRREIGEWHAHQLSLIHI